MLRCITGPNLLKMLLNGWLQKLEKLLYTHPYTSFWVGYVAIFRVDTYSMDLGLQQKRTAQAQLQFCLWVGLLIECVQTSLVVA